MSDRPGPPGGYGIDLPTGVLPPAEDRGQVTDPVAAISLAFGSATLVFGPCCFPFLGGALALTGVVLGIVSLSRIATHPGRYVGRGLAIAGIVVSVVVPIAYAVGIYLLTK